ncbi:hypothetical protein AABB24_039466 [Solanum stoloniferum]|uniref:Uncharacterized protein n=1 Tax=Solanum stoloniferum TaxID=62892 RepID=A0ABD2QQW2_9SOLN
MTGALAWQVTKPNKVAIFVFGGEMVRGFLPDSPLLVLSLVSLLCFLELSARSAQINVSSILALMSPKRWFGYLSSYSSAIPFEGIGISCTLNTTMDRRILGLFSSTLLPKVHI